VSRSSRKTWFSVTRLLRESQSLELDENPVRFVRSRNGMSSSEEVERWSQWALAEANRIDPVTSGAFLTAMQDVDNIPTSINPLAKSTGGLQQPQLWGPAKFVCVRWIGNSEAILENLVSPAFAGIKPIRQRPEPQHERCPHSSIGPAISGQAGN
jgi:hypothetical protein